MKMLMPSHAKNVQPYKEQTPLFLKHNVESQLDAMYQPTVRLKSGGYIVINQTEALIAIDVNSGKSTRERNIEQTALRTNLEAADEAARQCRMRDLAGLIVIDFIDMDEQRNNRSVERRLKDALKMDRARIQLGRISNFGLLEMSRQRRRSGIVDGTTHTCPTCGGAGAVRSQEMAALRILRAAENEAISGKAGHLHIRAALDVALYVLNHKRDWLTRITTDYGVTVEITADNTKAGDQYEIEKTGVRIEPAVQPAAVRADTSEPVEQLIEDESEQPAAARSSDDAEGGETGKKRRRRRRRRKDTGSSAPTEESEAQPSAAAASSDETDEDDEANASAQPDEESDRPKKRRRRGRRGGRKAMNKDQDSSTSEAADTSDEAPQTEAVATAVDPAAAEQPYIDLNDADDDAPPSDNLTRPTSQEDEPAVNSESPDTSENTGETSKKPAKVEVAAEATQEPKGPPRKGWWQRAIGG
jgi:ribonuclease E